MCVSRFLGLHVGWGGVGVRRGVCKRPPRSEEVVGSLQLELEMVVSPQMWVLCTQVRVSGIGKCSLTAELSPDSMAKVR